MSPDSRVVVLAGGTGGAMLARGMAEVVGGDLVVIANTGDDIEIHNAHVSPDPDLVSYWLADVIDDRGWGIKDDTFAAMRELRDAGEDVWFELGDRDLAICRERAAQLANGITPTATLEGLGQELGLEARVLPMSDDPVRTRIRARGRWHGFQEFMIREQARGPIDDVEFSGAQVAAATPEVLDAIASARAIVIGPSNPVASIAPILAVQGVRDALTDAAAAVVAVSPIVGGEVRKGPTTVFMEWAGLAATGAGVASYYGDLLDGLVTDERLGEASVPVLVTDTLMDSPASRVRLARESLELAIGLTPR